ncbi:MAG: thioredoxin domain-containing protein [Gemmatimonadaceae bacterium]
MPNRLANETSPYLLQHAQNPVDWYAWGTEAFERSRLEGKPILLSVGYSACHWCHVMERESFEDAETARVMNDLFVNVKVDREERPDVDSIYMQAVQAMNGHGGWPMTVFLTPELEPFWAGTYYPPTDRQGMPSFRRVLQAVADAYRNRPDDVRRVASSMREMYAATSDRVRSSGTPSPDLLQRAVRGLLDSYDHQNGGFGDAPKFPQAMAMEFLLQQWARTGNEAALEAVRHTFRQMARGGMYDQIGGGFARYSVDARWLVPHFEKMLYDNALLLRAGVHLLQATPDGENQEELRRVCIDTLEWLAREMTSAAGGFFSTLDADSEGEEGKFYVWSDAELRETLGDDAGDVMSYWGATPEGNFEGSNILHVATGARRPPIGALARAKQRLMEVRGKRVRPARDEKILASWNGLMLRAVAEAARVMGGNGEDADRYRDLAIGNGEFLFREMVRAGRVFRSHKAGVTRIGGFLEDYAAVALGALALYELTFHRVWLDRAHELGRSIVRWFWEGDDDAGAFFDTASDHEELLTRPRDVTDNATPSGTSLAIELLLRLGDLLGEADMVRRANSVLETLAEPMARYPLAFGHALTAADMAVFGAVEVAIAGEPSSPEFQRLASVVATTYVPSLVMAGGSPATAAGIALLADRETRAGRATAYVCRRSVCDEPVTEAAKLWEQLARATRPAERP